MNKFLVAAGMACAVIGLGLGSAALGNGGVKGTAPGMMVSPHTILLRQTIAVTVHTNIPKGSVEAGTLTLEGVAPLYVWADDRGELAARFRIEDMGLEVGKEVTMTLCGTYTNGKTFAIEDVVQVNE